jgi:hypothetical protein
MSHEYATACGLVAQKRDVLPGRAVTLKAEVEALSGDERVAFDSLLAAFVFGSDSPDLVGIAHDSL